MILAVGDRELSASDLYGVVKRAPLETKKSKPVSRYRSLNRSSQSIVSVDCRCNPGLFSVITLNSVSLPPATGLPDTLELKQRSKIFEPSVMAVTVNSTVSFPNLDQFYHNVFSYSKAKKFDLGKYKQGQTRFVTFDKPGIVQVFCEIHYSMRAYVHVVETPLFAVSDDNGAFSIKNVPPGDYTLSVWQEGQSDLTREIAVKADSVWVEIE